MADDYFDKPAIALPDDALIVVACGRNERARLPFWLDYYRSHGVDAFFFADNASDDGTTEYLREQGDVHLFWTDGSYVESKSGRLWTTELARHYGMNRWVLTLDADEQLVFPGSERVTIKELTRYLDDYGYQGVFCMFLDMYGSGPLVEAIYEPGTPFLQTCPWFDGNGYICRRSERFPFMQIFGGPRQRMFWENGGAGNGPSMRKVPLVKWHEDMEYIFSTHSLTPLRLADVTGALLHFKFFSSFADLAVREAARGDRTQSEDYRRYAQKVRDEKALTFRNETSRRFDRTSSLVDIGYMASSTSYARHARETLIHRFGGDVARMMFDELRGKSQNRLSGFSARNLRTVWPVLVDTFYGGMELEAPIMPTTVHFTKVTGEEITGLLVGGALKGVGKVVPLELRSGDEILATSEAKCREKRSGRYGFRFALDGSGYKDCFIVVAGTQENILTSQFDIPAKDTFLGSCEYVRDGVARGWVVNLVDPEDVVEIDVRCDGTLLTVIRADRERADLKKAGIGNGRHGFRYVLPNIARTEGSQIEFNVSGSKIPLRKTPVQLDKSASGIDGARLGEQPLGVANVIKDLFASRKTK